MNDPALTIEVFDPPMCCSTGVCGTDVDPQLSRFASDVAWLKEQGVSVRRYNMAQEPRAFMDNEQVKAVVNQSEGAALPAIVLNGRLVSQGLYPTREQLTTLMQSVNPAPVSVSLTPANQEQSDGCCGPEGCC